MALPRVTDPRETALRVRLSSTESLRKRMSPPVEMLRVFISDETFPRAALRDRPLTTSFSRGAEN